MDFEPDPAARAALPPRGGRRVRSRLLAAMAAASLLVWGAWWLAATRPAPAVQRTEAATRRDADRSTLPGASPALDSPRAPAAALEVGAGEAPRTAVHRERRLALEVHVFDRDERPVIGAQVLLAVADLETQRIGTTDGEGRLRVALRSRAPSLTAWVGVRSVWPREFQRVDLGIDEPARATLLAGAFDGTLLAGALVIRVGQVTADPWRVEIEAAAVELAAETTYEAWAERPPSDSAWIPEAHAEEDGTLLLADPFAAREPGDDPPEGDGPGTVISEEIEWSLDLGAVAAPTAEVPPTTATLTGRFVGPGDTAANGALVRARIGGRIHAARTDGDGSYRIGDLPSGEAVVDAGGGVHGFAAERLRLHAGRETRWEPRLERGLELRGRLAIDPGVRGWSVRAECERGTFAKQVPVAADGTFALPNLPALPLRLLAYPPARTPRLPSVLAEGLLVAPGEPARVFAPLAKPATLHGQLRGGRGEVHSGALLRIHTPADGRMYEVRTDFAGRCLVHLPAGPVELAVGRADLGWTPPAARALVAGELRELWPLSPPESGRLRLQRADLEASTPRPATFELLRRPGPLDALVWRGELPLALPYDLDLAPGDYALTLDGRLYAFAIEPGRALELTLD